MKSGRNNATTVTIGPKYQVVIPKEVRQRCANFRKGARVRVYPLDDATLAIKLEDGNWAESQYGVLEDYWKGIDVAKELKKTRDEWDEG